MPSRASSQAIPSTGSRSFYPLTLGRRTAGIKGPITALTEYGALKLDQAKRVKELERENARLRKAAAELTLDKLILKEAAEVNF